MKGLYGLAGGEPCALAYVIEKDQLQYDLKAKPVFIHNHHRWVLSVLHWAQENELVCKPCTLLSLDGHWDWASYRRWGDRPRAHASWKEMLAKGITHERLDRFLSEENSIQDDDAEWLVAGLDLGMIDTIFLFGGQLEEASDKPGIKGAEKKDIRGDNYEIFCVPSEGTDSHDIHTLAMCKTELHENEERRFLPDKSCDLKRGGFGIFFDTLSQVSSKSLFLTLDLDLFRADSYPEKSLWMRRNLEWFLSLELTLPSNSRIISLGTILKDVIRRAAINDIAIEAYWCGQANVGEAKGYARELLDVAFP